MEKLGMANPQIYGGPSFLTATTKRAQEKTEADNSQNPAFTSPVTVPIGKATTEQYTGFDVAAEGEIPDVVTNSHWFSSWRKNENETTERPTPEKLAKLQSQVNSGIALSDEQMEQLLAQHDMLFENCDSETKSMGQAHSYMLSHLDDMVDGNGNFKLPADFDEQPKEVKEYILSKYHSASGEDYNN